jgi:hypothetical protein
MATPLDLSTLESLVTVDSNDKLLGYNPTARKFGFISASVILNNGYACRRRNLTTSSPTLEAVGNLEYLRNLPSLLGLGCYLVQKNHSRRKLDPTNHYKFSTGETAALDGTMGDYMWGWNTKFYIAEPWIEGDYEYHAISLKPIPGRTCYAIPVASTSALGVSVVDRDNLELCSVVNNTARYRGGNNNADLDDAFNTQLGRAATGLTAATFGSYARKKGSGWEGYWYTFPAVIRELITVIFGTLNVQASVNSNKDANGLYQGGFGSGVYGSTWWTSVDGFAQYPFLPTTVGIDLADGCGSVSYAVTIADGTTVNVNVPVFFGLKNFFSYLGRWERGKLISKNTDGSADIYIVPKLYTEYTMSSLDGLIKAATAPPSPVASTWYYVSQISQRMLCHTPTAIDGTSSTYYADGYYNDNAVSGLRVPAVGGAASFGSLAGLEFLHVYSGVSTSPAHYGSPLCEAAENWDTTPTLVAT